LRGGPETAEAGTSPMLMTHAVGQRLPPTMRVLEADNLSNDFV